MKTAVGGRTSDAMAHAAGANNTDRHGGSIGALLIELAQHRGICGSVVIEFV
jgi:hypothetical protein